MCRRLLRFIILLPAMILIPGISIGHSPHHVITDVVAAPNMTRSESDIFVIITDQLFKSAENGAAWKNLVNGLNNQYSFTSIGISPTYDTDGTVFVATAGDGVYRSSDKGDKWQKINAGLGRVDISRLSVSPNHSADGRILAAADSGGVWRKIGANEDWQMVLTENVQINAFAERFASAEESAILAGDSNGRVWRSQDNGRLWEIVHELPGDKSITSIAATGGTIFVGTAANGLLRSTDAGRSFHQVKALRSIRREDCRGNDLEAPLSDQHVTSISLSADQSTLFVTTWYSGVFVSVDRGDSWSKWDLGLSCDQQADDMSEAHFRKVVHASNQEGMGVFWLGAFDGLFRTNAESAGWQQLETLPLGLIKGMAVTGGEGHPLSIALATYGGGFYFSEDHGESWTIGKRGLQTTRLTGLSFSPDFSVDGVIYAGASRRLLRSADRGESWQRIDLQKVGFGRRVLNKLERMGAPVDWLGAGDSSSRPVYPTMIVQPPGTGGRRAVFGTRFHGVLEYDHDTGETRPLWSGTDRIISSLEISPHFEQDSTLFASIRGDGVMHSLDGGKTWSPVNDGLTFVKRWSESPQNGDFRRDVLVAISPNFASGQRIFAGSPAGDGLYTSDDRGHSWVRLQGLNKESPAPVLAIAVSPEFDSDNNLVVSVKGSGLFISVDGGVTFRSVGAELHASIEWLEYSPNFQDDHSIVAASDEQLYISEDRGASWREVPRPVRYEDMRDVISYEGEWQRSSGENYSAMTETGTFRSGSSAKLSFIGGGVVWLGSCSPDHGSADVYIDAEYAGSVDCSSRVSGPMQELFSVRDLEHAAHNIEIRPVIADGAGAAIRVSIDAFDILPAENKPR